MILLVDADYFAYSTAAACQQVIKWDDDIITTHINMMEAKDVFQSRILSAAEAAGYDSVEGTLDDAGFKIVLCWSCPSRRYHRHAVSPDYKSNRTSKPPLGLRDLIEWAKSTYTGYVREHLEADDILGILATRPSLLGPVLGLSVEQLKLERLAIVGVDKDLLQIPGTHINFKFDPPAEIFVKPADGLFQLYKQALTGDASDGYTGLPGVGDVKALRILTDCTTEYELRNATIAAYLKAGYTVEDFARQFNLARILTADTYDFKQKAPILWDPSDLSPSKKGQTA